MQTRTKNLRGNAVQTALTLVIAGCLAATLALSAPVSTTSVSRFSDRSTVVGASSSLIRNDAGVTMSLMTSDLEPGAAYTIWWVVFNNPEHCAAPGACSGADLAPRGGDPAVQSSVLYAVGHVISETGVADFAAHLQPGDVTGARFGPGLIDPMKAEIHLVVRSHGLPIADMIEAQISSINGGCPPNTCDDHQFAVHTAGTDAVAESLAATKAVVDRIAERLGLKP